MFRLMRAADLVHLVLAYPVGKYQLVAAILARAARRSLIVTHELVVDLDEIAMPQARRTFWRVAFRRYRRLARVNIACSRANRDLLLGRYGFPAASTPLIYNGADLRRFTPLQGAARDAARQAIAATVAGDPWPADAIVVDDVADAADLGGHDGATRAHRFDQGEGQPLEMARQHEQIGGAQPPRHLPLGQGAGESNQ